MTERTWFEITAKANFERFLLPAAGHPMAALQIGAFKGDASVWLLENVLTHPDSTLTDVDTWEGSPAESTHDGVDWEDVERLYWERVAPYDDRCFTRKMPSADFFAFDTMRYDFIYVDGSHEGLDVLKDGMNAWACLNPGGIIAFDDYTWGQDRPAHLRPHEAIDALLNVLGDQCTLMHRGGQVWIANVPNDPERVIPGSVAVGIISSPTSVSAGFRLSLTRLLAADSKALHRVVSEIAKVTGTAGVPAARNEVVERFLTQTPKAEWLWFIDTDATFSEDILELLLAAAHPTQRPIMGGLAFRMPSGEVNSVHAPRLVVEPMLYVRHEHRFHSVVSYPIDSVIKLDGLPTHCLLIHRSVLEDSRWQEDAHHHPWFRMGELNGSEISEDFFFCVKAAELGYPIHAFTKAKTGHEKTFIFDEDLFLRLYPRNQGEQ